MILSINGEVRDFESPLCISDLLGILEIQINGVAVAVNLEIVSRNKYNETVLSDGDEIEIVRAVGGG